VPDPQSLLGRWHRLEFVLGVAVTKSAKAPCPMLATTWSRRSTPGLPPLSWSTADGANLTNINKEVERQAAAARDALAARPDAPRDGR
jgi:hypothetical protein